MTKDLCGTWSLQRLLDGSVRSMAVPGDIVSALIAAGELGDPYGAEAESGALWVGREDWKLSREFELSESEAGARLLSLSIGALDCVAEVSVNGVRVGEGSSMFVPALFPIGRAARVGRNAVEVTIRSAETEAARRAGLLPYPSPASTYPVSSPHRNLVRKVQCMAGWDWGPCLLTGGVYGGASVLVDDELAIRAIGVTTRRAGGDAWAVICELELEAAVAGEIELEARLDGARIRTVAHAASGVSRHRLELRVEDPELWWPAGHGAQPLYRLEVEARPVGGTSAASRLAAREIGFRDVRVRADDDAHGRSMAFEFNGKPVFLKGANWIPQDALPGRWSDTRAAGLLRSALEAGMNAVRVWGGGRYESDGFYEFCDRMGIVVWQDFMFSCATYPSTQEFIAEVEAEAKAQIARLKHHPSIALWCGNNEDLGAIGWFDESKAAPARYIVDYDRLNEGVLGRLVAELDPDRPWWPSSPSAGPGDYSDNWHSDRSGDMHYWSVWHEGKPFDAYLDVAPRFCSEFGFQSLPSPAVALTYAAGTGRNVTGPAMERHQRHPRGNELIVSTLTRYFRMPEGFEQTLYLSQVQQAMAIREAVEHWRSLTPRCMGVLYWQLNDVWPCASWSSLEYGGRWKLLHFEAARFYAPAAPFLSVKAGVVRAGFVYDGPREFEGELRLRLFDLSGAILDERRKAVGMAGPAARTAWELPISEFPAKADEAFCVLDLLDWAERAEADAVAAGQAPFHRTWRFLTEPKRCELEDPRIVASESIGADGTPSYGLRCERPAFWVAPGFGGESRAARLGDPDRLGRIDPPAMPGRFDDSGFILLPGETKAIRYLSGEEGESAPPLESLARFHLRGSYQA